MMMEKMFKDMFLTIRNDDHNATLKAIAKEKNKKHLSKYVHEVKEQKFTASGLDGSKITGINIIGIMPGRNRGKEGDAIILVGAHYDTVRSSPGVDDNASGVVALLETARILSPKMGKYNNTIM